MNSTLNKKYLTNDLKEYYSKCLREEIELGNIDKGLSDYLISISDSCNIRPIFSKKGKNITGNGLRSYLRIAFTKEIENILYNELVPYFMTNFNSNRKYRFKFKEIEAHSQEKRNINEHNNGSKWLVDPEYFNVTQILFELKNGNQDIHEKFWHKLEEKLSIL